MFCKKCGAQVKDGAKFCHKCGFVMTPSPSMNSPEWGQSGAVKITPPKKSKKPLILILVIAAILIIAAIAVLVILFVLPKLTDSGNGVSSGEKAIETYLEAYAEEDADTMMNLVPADVLENIQDEYNLDEKGLRKAVENYLSEKSDEFSDNKIEEFTEAEEQKRSMFQEYMDDAGIDDYIDADKVDELIEYEAVTDSDRTWSEVVAFQYDDSETWYSLNAASVVRYAAYND